MTKDIRRNIDATIKLNESLDEGPVGWAADKLAKAGQRVASKATWGATKQRLKKNVDVRSGAQQLIKRWNAGYAGRGMQRTPANIIRFLAKDQDMKMSKDLLKTAWNRTPQLTKNFGTYDEVINQLKKRGAPEDRRDQSQQESIPAPPPDRIFKEGQLPPELREVAKIPATQQMSIDNLRNLLINAIHVKNEADAEGELGDVPGTEKEKRLGAPRPAPDQVVAPEEPKAEPEPKPKAPEPTVADLKKAGAQDMDGDKDYDWEDVAKTAVAQGKGEEALSALMKAISPEQAALVKAVLQGKIR